MVVICIARGSTPAERQASIDKIAREATRHSAADADAICEAYRWTEEHASTSADHPDAPVTLFVEPDRDTARDRQGPDDPIGTGFRRAAGESDSDSAVMMLIDSLATAADGDVQRIIDSENVAVHDCTHRLTLYTWDDDGTDAGLPESVHRAVEVLAGTADHADALLAGIDWGGGRPPIGTTSEGGRLAPDENYDDVCRTLQRVADDDLAKTRAADRLGCARKTIDNALDRPDLYRLE